MRKESGGWSGVMELTIMVLERGKFMVLESNGNGVGE
jgi:hypothetical protein